METRALLEAATRLKQGLLEKASKVAVARENPSFIENSGPTEPPSICATLGQLGPVDKVSFLIIVVQKALINGRSISITL